MKLNRFKLIDKCPKPRVDTGCTYCHVDLPKPIDHTTNLNGTQPAMWKHMLILSHPYKSIADLPPNINTEGLAKLVALLAHLRSPAHPVCTSHVFLGRHHERPTSPDNELVYLFPDNIKVEFSRSHLERFVRHYLVPKDPQGRPITAPVFNPFKQPPDPHEQTPEALSGPEAARLFTQEPLQKPLILVCGHGTRDGRCGAMAPYILAELDRIKSNEVVGTISHIGGHAYAGNVLFYPENCWYGRVGPQQVQGIYHSLKEGKIVQELYRGRVDN